jgi:hypothetical protein
MWLPGADTWLGPNTMVLTIIDEKGVSCAPHFRLWIFSDVTHNTVHFVIPAKAGIQERDV